MTQDPRLTPEFYTQADATSASASREFSALLPAVQERVRYTTAPEEALAIVQALIHHAATLAAGVLNPASAPRMTVDGFGALAEAHWRVTTRLLAGFSVLEEIERYGRITPEMLTGCEERFDAIADADAMRATGLGDYFQSRLKASIDEMLLRGTLTRAQVNAPGGEG